jgi:hypothetical protein
MDVNDVNELAEIEALSKKVSNTISNLVVINHLRKPFIFKPCPIEELIYNIEDIIRSKNKETASSEVGDLPDDSYEITTHDLRVMLDDLQRKKYFSNKSNFKQKSKFF